MKKIICGLASASLLMTVIAPSALAADLEISGNGASSTNTIKVDNDCTVTVNQVNTTKANVGVTSSASTGGNDASKNTGADVSITTGDATSEVAVTVTGGDNSASVPSCCPCSQSDPAQLISGNGYKSTNKIKTENDQTVTTNQLGKTKLNALVTSKAKTGQNKAKKNTGPGSVDVTTGDASSTVGVAVQGGSNTL